MQITIPIYNNIARCVDNANATLNCYLDILHSEDRHLSCDLADVIISLASCTELLVKVVLLEEHWTFIFDDINKATKKKFDDGDFTSVSFVRGVERLNNLCCIATPLDNCVKLYKLRNKIQHLDFQEPLANVLSILSRAIVEVLEFVRTYVTPYIDSGDCISPLDLKESFGRLEKCGIALNKILSDTNQLKKFID